MAPGLVTNLEIVRTFYEKLPSPFGNCRPNPLEPALNSDSDYYKYTISMGKYTQNQCFEVCFQYEYAIPNCNCADPSVGSNVNNVNVCTYGLDQICLNEQRSLFSSSNCLAECPEVCDRPDYYYDVSISQYPTP